MPTLGNALDFSKYEARNIRAHQLGAAPSSPLTGQMYYNTTDNTLWWWDGTTWISARGGTSATPPATASSLGTIQLAGDLSGTATSPQIAAGAITDVDVNAANKDGVAGTASMRTLGPGAQQAAPGNDSRFTDARTPTAHHTTHEPGGSDPLTVDANNSTGSLRTLGYTSNKAMPGNTTLDVVSWPIASVNINSQRLNNLLNPLSPQDAATKFYVDQTAQGLNAKASVKAASTANLTLSGTQTVDGIALVANDRILVKDQTTPSQNGIYVVSAGAWTRASDTDTWPELVSAYTWIEQGTTQADTGWISTVDSGGTIGTTSVTWTQFSGAGQITAGSGLTKTGNSLDVGGTANRITVGADTVDIAASYIGQASITTLGTVTTGIWNATAVPVAYGGTGQATAKAGRETGLGAAGYYSALGPSVTGNTITVPQGTHGLRSSRGLLVQVQDETSGAVEIPDIVVAANGDVTVTYGVSITANAKRVTVIG
jgi:hypothetical protein